MFIDFRTLSARVMGGTCTFGFQVPSRLLTGTSPNLRVPETLVDLEVPVSRVPDRLQVPSTGTCKNAPRQPPGRPSPPTSTADGGGDEPPGPVASAYRRKLPVRQFDPPKLTVTASIPCARTPRSTLTLTPPRLTFALWMPCARSSRPNRGLSFCSRMPCSSAHVR